MKTKMITLKDVPLYVAESFDPHTHKTLDDVKQLVRHELDLYNEGEDNDILTERTAKRARRFLTTP